jgi:hypothetical protein
MNFCRKLALYEGTFRALSLQMRLLYAITLPCSSFLTLDVQVFAETPENRAGQYCFTTTE